MFVGLPPALWPPAECCPRLYEVRAVLPEVHGQHQYRIKSLIEPYERVVSKHEFREE
jgi:hypothetical protein